jgi:hypothetical protein
MALTLVNLNDIIRKLMLIEVEYDAQRGKTFLSPSLNRTGRTTYLSKLKHSIESEDDLWLANQLRGYFNPTEPRQAKKGITSADGYEILAEDEFNRFYMRALCLYAIDKKIASLIVCKTNQVRSSRTSSKLKIGSSVSPQKLLDDLRDNVGQKTRLGLGDANSLLSVRLP